MTARGVKSVATTPSCFVSILSSGAEHLTGFVEEQQLISFNTRADGGSDEYNAADNMGLHLYGEAGLAVHSDFMGVTDPENDNVVINVAYVHKNDYAAAYDSIDCWRGNRWENACDRAGTTFLDNYGGYPEIDTGDEEEPPPAPDDDGGDAPNTLPDPPEPTPEGPPGDIIIILSGSDYSLDTLTDHTAQKVTNDVFKTIEAYPIPRT